MGYRQLPFAKIGSCSAGFRPAVASAICGVSLALVAACTSEDLAPTAPSRSTAEIAASNAVGIREPTPVNGDDPLSTVLPNAPGVCLVGVRTPSGQYPARSARVSFPAGLMSDQGRTTRFAYRGWAPGMAEPVLLVVCNIPDKPGSREFIAARFRAREMNDAALRAFARMLGVGSGDDLAWTYPHVMPGAARVYMTDGLVSDFP